MHCSIITLNETLKILPHQQMKHYTHSETNRHSRLSEHQSLRCIDVHRQSPNLPFNAPEGAAWSLSAALTSSSTGAERQRRILPGDWQAGRLRGSAAIPAAIISTSGKINSRFIFYLVWIYGIISRCFVKRKHQFHQGNERWSNLGKGEERGVWPPLAVYGGRGGGGGGGGGD